MDPGFHRVLLRRQPERVPAHGVQDVEAPHALVTRDHISGGVAFEVADVEPRTGGVRKHVQTIELWTSRIFLDPERTVLLPVGLPLGFDRPMIVRLAHMAFTVRLSE